MTIQTSSDQSLFSEIRQYISLFQKWAWLLALTTILGAVAMYLYDKRQAPIYQSSTTIMIVDPASTQASVVTDYLSSDRLLNTYSELFTTRPLLENVIQRVGLNISVESLKRNIEVVSKAETKLLIIQVQDIDPIRAALISNTMIDVLAEQNERLIFSRYATAEENLQSQIDSVEEQITKLSSEIAQENQQQLLDIEEKMAEFERNILDLVGEITELSIILGLYQFEEGESVYINVEPTDANRVSVLRAKELELSQLQTTLQLYQNIYYELTITGSGSNEFNPDSSFDQRKASLALYQQTYQNLLNDYENINLARLESESNIVQVEAAIPDPKPISPTILQDVSLAAVVGLIVGAGVAYLIEMLDDSIKKPEDVTRILGHPLIGNILHVDVENGPITIHQPRSPVSEAYRSLRTNIQYASVDKPLKSLLVSSPSPGDGKSTIAINLAVVLAQSDQRVILVDADLRRPVIHKRLGLSNRQGLTSLFMRTLDDMLSSTQIIDGTLDNLLTITSGGLPPNPSELFMSDRMGHILERLNKISDIVIIDSPPFMAVTDAAVLASRVDGVLMVIKPGATRLSACQQAVNQLQQVGGNLLGLVMNDIAEKGMRSYYYKNGYYSQYQDYYGESSADE